MKKFLGLIFSCALLTISLSAQIFDLLQEHPQEERVYQDSKSIFLSYESAPQTIYIGEIFPIKLKAIITREDYQKIVTKIENDADFRVLNLSNKWEKDADEHFFTNIFYLQALKESYKLPNFSIELIDDEMLIEEGQIEGESIETVKISGDGRFSNVVAQSLAVKKEITNKFDDESLIVTLEVEATYSNLKDFKLPPYDNNSIETLREDISLQYIEYNIIIPNYIKELEFTYFNTVNRNFQLIKVPLNIKSDDVSTHTDLNPKQNKFKFYKDVLMGVFSLLAFIVFVVKRYKIALIVSILIAVYLFYENNPYDKITLPSNTTIRILPTEKSSIFHMTEGSLEVEKLMRKNGYIKIMLPSGRIGWIKEKDVTKN